MKRNTWQRLAAAAALASCVWLASGSARADVVDFEDLVLGTESYYAGYDSQPYPADNIGEEHPWTSRGVEFFNYYHEGWDPDWGGYEFTYWEGWAYSNITDNTTPGYSNRYSTIAGGGVFGSPNYAIAYLPFEYDPFDLDIDAAQTSTAGSYGVYLTNSTYAYFSMAQGDFFARKFGWWDVNGDGDYDDPGDYDGDYPDWFKLVITGRDASGTEIPGLAPVEFYLADFQSADPLQDYILSDWTWADLSSLVTGGAERLHMVLQSSDFGAHGINTPLFFAMDNGEDSQAPVPEPATLLLAALGGALLLVWRRYRRR